MNLIARKQTYCPCCDTYDVQWLDWNDRYRGVICSFCKSHPRHRLLYLFLQEETTLFSAPLEILHIAPSATLERRIRASGHFRKYITGDLKRKSVDVILDIGHIPFANDSFDVILCNHVLEHVDDDRSAMAELFRTLKPNGWASLLVPNSGNPKTLEIDGVSTPEERDRIYGQGDHVRLYGLDYADRLRLAGFRVTVRNYSRELGSDRERYGLLRCGNIYLGNKLHVERKAEKAV
jgi:SAM-dependent methyltransferase